MSKKNASGTGTIRKKTVTRNGKEYVYWEARYTAGYHPGTGKQIQKSVTAKTQKECAAKLKAAISKSAESRPIQDADNAILQHWLKSWLEDYVKITAKPTTANTYAAMIESHINPELGATKLKNLTPQLIQRAMNNIYHSGVSPSTVRLCGAVLSTALKKAQITGILQQTPFRDIVYPKKQKSKIRPLNPKEITAFLKAAADTKFYSCYFVLLFTGMRVSELCGLKWDNVNFKTAEITIDHQIKRVNGEFLTMTPKSGSARTIVAAPAVMDILKRQRKTCLEMKFKNAMLWQDNNLVFPSETGTAMHAASIRKPFKKIAQSINRPDLRLHDLRHTFAVASLSAGTDIKTVQESLGHATAEFTLNVYTHVIDDMRQTAANNLEAYIKAVK